MSKLIKTKNAITINKNSNNLKKIQIINNNDEVENSCNRHFAQSDRKWQKK